MHKANRALCNDIDRILAPYAARRLSPKEAASSPYEALYGWEVDSQVAIDGRPVILWLLFYTDINENLPKIVIASPSLQPGRIPHLEEDGKLCVWPSRFIVDLNDIKYIKELLEDAVSLLREAVGGDIDHHFEDEFQSYWSFHCIGYFECDCILDVSNLNSRTVCVIKTKKNKFIYADTADQLVSWMDNQNILPKEKGKRRDRAIARIDRSAIIYLPRAIHPAEYPKKASDLYDLLKAEFGSDANDLLVMVATALASKAVSVPPLLLSFPSESGRSVVGLMFSRGIFSRHNRRSVGDGFRESIPLHHILDRTSNVRTNGVMVRRADPSWTLGRDFNEKRSTLADHSVAIVGCGSLGSSIAKLLVKSGLERLSLIDNEALASENIGRHELGYDSVGGSKVKGLSYKLSKEYPHIKVNPIGSRLGDDAAVNEALSNSDVVLSCTGDWYADNLLLKIQEEEQFPLVYAFVESHACAGHVLVNMPGEDAFLSLHICSGEQVGKLLDPITKWDEETLVKIPACAGEFQPYGAIEIGHVHSLAAKKIISIILADDQTDMRSSQTVWLGDTEELVALGGQWNPAWEEICCKIGPGRKVIERQYKNGNWHCGCSNG